MGSVVPLCGRGLLLSPTAITVWLGAIAGQRNRSISDILPAPEEAVRATCGRAKSSQQEAGTCGTRVATLQIKRSFGACVRGEG